VKFGLTPQLRDWDWDWDLISEWILPNEEALEEIYRVMQLSGIDELFHADEDRFHRSHGDGDHGV
jgi:hypothetical protein